MHYFVFDFRDLEKIDNTIIPVTEGLSTNDEPKVPYFDQVIGFKGDIPEHELTFKNVGQRYVSDKEETIVIKPAEPEVKDEEGNVAVFEYFDYAVLTYKDKKVQDYLEENLTLTTLLILLNCEDSKVRKNSYIMLGNLPNSNYGKLLLDALNSTMQSNFFSKSTYSLVLVK